MFFYRIVRQIKHVHEVMTVPASKRGIVIPVVPDTSTTERPETKSSDLRSGLIPPADSSVSVTPVGTPVSGNVQGGTVTGAGTEKYKAIQFSENSASGADSV